MNAPTGAMRSRQQLGAWYTPHSLVDLIVDQVVTEGWLRGRSGRPLRVLDPACGDGRFLAAVGRRLGAFGADPELIGVDVDRGAVDDARRRTPEASYLVDDALERSWTGERFDLVVGNPPFLSQLAAATARGGASRHGGGPYADGAVEFLALAARLVDPLGGRVALVLPQSVLAARDAGPVRAMVDAHADLVWSWSTDEKVFDANVLTCALAFEFREPSAAPIPAGRADTAPSWATLLTQRRSVPPVPPDGEVTSSGTLGERARLNANFRDEYYGMIPAVGDHHDGPPLITSGSIDPGRCLWGRRPVTFAKRRFDAPRLRLDRLDGPMRRWAERRAVPKVLVANQTAIIEAVADPNGDWLPGVPVIGAYPVDPGPESTWRIAAVLTSPYASAWAWRHRAGSGLSAGSIRLGPALLAALPWPAGDLGEAVTALRDGDVRSCARAVHSAWSIDADDALFRWWTRALDRIEARRPDEGAAEAG